jgi:L-seryl-tRNA(Ser) seleniumtransferase
VSDARRNIPSVDRLLSSEPFAALLARFPRELVAGALQSETERVRSSPELLVQARDRVADPAWYAERVAAGLARLRAATLHPVINATGVVLHTNLGRAPLAPAAIAAVQELAAGYCSLEYDLVTGGRGSRYAHCRDLLVHLTGAEDALVVNNNAAALVLSLNTLARGKDAVISRGELVEIGGAFRIPDIMQRSGAHLREVGTTNRTHAQDYRAALSPLTGAIVKVHPSNFTMEGFIAEVGVSELAQIAAAAGLPLIYDMGSGLLLDAARLGLDGEPSVAESVRAGAAVVTMSGDKLLGGPQCGIILGTSGILQRMRGNPLCRAFRVDKLTIAALTATLRLYLEPERALREIPVLRTLTIPFEELEARTAAFAARCTTAGIATGIVHGTSAVGGGAAPNTVLRTVLLRVTSALPAHVLEARLRAGHPAIVCRIVDDAVALDLRTVPPGTDGVLLDALTAAGAGAAART